MRKAAFIDRDGVINQEVNYLHEADKTALIPGVGSAIRKLNEAGVAAVVVTNQAGVAKGYYPESDI
ncbi:MAG: HAD-IIIA family hydrolase, partial [Lentisphaeria bacterium]|nr:HAD-IIIA family hydrolase [Lentisphaeria bacterium]